MEGKITFQIELIRDSPSAEPTINTENAGTKRTKHKGYCLADLNHEVSMKHSSTVFSARYLRRIVISG